MRCVELFSGTESFSKVARSRGHDTFTIDNNSRHNPDLCIDMMNMYTNMLPDGFRSPDIVWASPPCTAFSVASIGRHWKHGKPSMGAIQGINILAKTINLIMVLRPKYFFIENPRGMMRKLPIMDCMNKDTVTYCQYGDDRMKPTDIWTNCLEWVPRPMCRPGSDCHVSAPRGSISGTQGLKDNTARSVIPPALFEEIFDSMELKQ